VFKVRERLESGKDVGGGGNKGTHGGEKLGKDLLQSEGKIPLGETRRRGKWKKKSYEKEGEFAERILRVELEHWGKRGE